MKIEKISFNERIHRSRYITDRFAPYLKGKVLDVGCDNAYLKTLIPKADYTGIDMGGKPDIVVNLDKVERLPFPDQTFDTVVCTDVLEHLNQFHRIFDELIRVTKGVVILSLPNCWVNARQPIERGYGHFAHYGLPITPPFDRHRWFFSWTEIRDFLQKKEEEQKFRIESIHATEKPKAHPIRWLRRARYPHIDRYLNRYAHTLWAVLKKN